MRNAVNEELGLSHRKIGATLGDKARKQTGRLERSGSMGRGGCQEGQTDRVN